ncbi:unnamed protein product [Meloidogyne enterolobii]|uniref:Uncharacterized protein n=1 Tax=Meloidogyne enterolobii TaxID=390850 RepID=A0ACB0ZG27_MELEN
MTSYISGVLVFKASNGDTGLLWFPSDCRQKHCQTGLALFQLGQWLLYDRINDIIVRPLDGMPPYETRLYRTESSQRDAFVEISVPLVFFSDKVFNQIVAYAPGFGRVGSFFRQDANLKMDCLYHAWIAFFGLYRDPNLLTLMNTFDVQWLLTFLAEPFSTNEMISASESGIELSLVNGIVINLVDGFDDSGGSDSGNDNQENGDEVPQHHTFKIVTFWTPWLHSICKYKYDETAHPKLDFRVGQWFKFMPAANWSSTGVAVSPFPVQAPKGMSVIARNPLKLRISHALYNLDQDPAAFIVRVPDWLGVLQSGREFITSLRRARQSRPNFAPRLIVELNDVYNWVLRDFDGRTGSPIRVAPAQEVMDHEPGDVDEEGVEVKESDIEVPRPTAPILTGGFGYSNRSTNIPFVSSTPKLSTTNNNTNDFGDLLDDRKKVHSTDGGFGRSRHKARPLGQVSRPVVNNEHSADNERSQSNISEEAKENDMTHDVAQPPTSVNATRGSFGGSRRGAKPRPQFSRASPNPPSRPPSRQEGKTTQRRSSPISSRHNGTFLDQCNKRSGGIEKKNLSGVVVAKATSNNRSKNGIIIYSPVFPEGEISVPVSLCGDLSVGSWVKFNATIMGEKITTTDFEVEKTPPFETKACGNTVKIKLNAYVPKRWYPRMSTFVPIVETDFVKVVDSKGLFDETCANQQLTVWIERMLEGNSQYNIVWHVDQIDE